MTPRDSELAFIIRAINAVGRGLARVGIEPGVFEVEGQLARARAAVGLEDFGGDEFLEPFAVLCADVRELGRELRTVARIGLARDIQRSLVTRLRTQELLRRHPEIREEQIVEPIFIIGSPRTGTTMLHNLLSRDPGASAPLLWELLEPAPHIERRPDDIDPRIGNAKRLQAEITRLVPKLFAAHPLVWDWPEECLWLFANSFLSEIYLLRFPAPGYRRMLLSADWTWAVDEYLDALRLLQWQRRDRPRWVLKAPGHALRLPELAAAFPDARFIRTHRDPLEAIASTCSVIERGRIATHAVDPHAIGHEVLDLWAERAPTRLLDACDWLDEARCYDIAFHDLVADPFPVIERMYTHFNLELTDPSPMRQWLTDNPRHSKGRHSYTLDDYGISEPDLLERTTRYRTHFAEYL